MTKTTLTALAIAALAGAGCSSSPTETETTNAGKGVKFAQCMRDNGVREFPDPDASGELTIDGVVNGSSLDPDGAAWQGAIRACKDLRPPGFTGHERDAGQQEHALAFAECIREHGVEDFPDPAPDAPLVDTRRIPSTSKAGGMDVLNAAMQTCGEVFSDQLGVGRP